LRPTAPRAPRPSDHLTEGSARPEGGRDADGEKCREQNNLLRMGSRHFINMLDIRLHEVIHNK